MVVEFTYCRSGQSNEDVLTEYVQAVEEEDAVSAAKRELRRINQGGLSFTPPYKLVGAREYTPPDPALSTVHDWKPSSPVVFRNSHGRYELVVCGKCGITGQRYFRDPIGRVKRGKPYRFKLYADCRQAKKALAKRKPVEEEMEDG